MAKNPTQVLIQTRKLKATQIPQLVDWLDNNLFGQATIRNIPWDVYFKKYVVGIDEGKKPKHQFKVWFTSETDARHFMMDWA